MLFQMPVWASRGASNMEHVKLPSWANDVTVFADHDAAGTEAALRCCRLWEKRVIRLRIVRARQLGKDVAGMAGIRP